MVQFQSEDQEELIFQFRFEAGTKPCPSLKAAKQEEIASYSEGGQPF